MALFELYRQARLVGVFVLLCLALALRSCLEPAKPHPVCSAYGLVPAAQAAGLPGGLVWSPRPRLRVVVPGDTSRRGPAGADLQRKALPRCRWSGGYLVYPLPRRPRQAVLDAAAAAARQPRP